MRGTVGFWIGVVLLAAACVAPPAFGEATTTVQRTVQDCDGDRLLDEAPGEPQIPFADASGASDEACVKPAAGSPLRLTPSRSIVNFLQLTDFQVVDEESPGRVEWLDGTQRFPGLQPFSAAYRPQESLSTQVTEAMIRQARNAVSPVTGHRLDLTILTGDNADSQQYNETRWFIDMLDGTTGTGNPDPEMSPGPDRKIDPNSGIPVAGCAATPGTIYDGVRGGGDPAVPDDGYYEPDASGQPGDDGDGYSPDPAQNAQETGRDVRVRDYPGLFEAANRPFEAVGIGMPWYSAFGNHDALIQGNAPDAYAGPFGSTPEVFDPVFNEIATGCAKVLQPSAATLALLQPLFAELEALREGGISPGEQPEVDTLTARIISAAADASADPCAPEPGTGCDVDIVPPDPRRCYVAKDTPNTAMPGTPCETGGWIQQHFRTTGTPAGHGFARRPPRAIANHDGYYAFSPRPGLRFVVLDSITDECGAVVCSEGSIDHPQFRWLRREINRAADRGRYVIVFSHHTLRTIRFPSTDPTEQPIHNGEAQDRENLINPTRSSPARTLEELYCRHPNVIAHVDGHEHQNFIEDHECGRDDPPACACPGQFWEISTAAHIDWPQQSRMIELVRIDGAMSFVVTLLDHDGPANPMGLSPGANQGHAPEDVPRLAGIAREIAFNDYQGSEAARGTREDRNVILPTDRPPPPYAPAP